MVWELSKAVGGVIVQEDEGIADQDCERDKDEDPLQPVARGRGTVPVERLSERMGRVQSRRFGGPAGVSV